MSGYFVNRKKRKSIVVVSLTAIRMSIIQCAELMIGFGEFIN